MNNQPLDFIREWTAQYAEMENSSVSLEENLRIAYMRYCENKGEPASQEAAEEVVCEMMEGIAAVERELSRERTLDDVKEALSSALENSTSNMTLREQYDVLMKTLFMLQAGSLENMKALSGDSQIELTSRYENMRGNLVVPEEGALTEDMIFGVMRQVAEGVNQCGSSSILAAVNAQMTALSDAIRCGKCSGIALEQASIDETVMNAWDDSRRRAIIAMGTYLAYEEGMLQNAPVAQQEGHPAYAIGVLAAGAFESGKVINEALAGKTTWEKAREVIGKIACITATVLVIAGYVLFVVVAIQVLGAAATVGAALIGVGILALLLKGYDDFAELIGDYQDVIAQAAEDFADFVKNACVSIKNWIVNAVQWVRGHTSATNRRAGVSSVPIEN